MDVSILLEDIKDIDKILQDFIIQQTTKLINRCRDKPLIVHCNIINRNIGTTIFNYSDNDTEIYSEYFGSVSNNLSSDILYSLAELFIKYRDIQLKYNLGKPFIRYSDNVCIFRDEMFSNIYVLDNTITMIEYRDIKQTLDLPLTYENIEFCRCLVRDSKNIGVNLLNTNINPTEYNKAIRIFMYIYNMVGGVSFTKFRPKFTNNILTIKNKQYYIDTFDNLLDILINKYPEYVKLRYIFIDLFINRSFYKRFIILHMLLCFGVMYLVCSHLLGWF
jgi:hypothetical protein